MTIAAGGLTQAAKKKASAAAADAGNLPPMSDLASMFRDMITRDPNSDASTSSSPSKASTSSGARVEAIVSDDEEEGSSPKKSKGAGIEGKKQTTLFGFIKPQKPAEGKTKGKGKGKGKDAEVDDIDDHLAGVDAYTKPKGHYLAQAVKKMGGRKLRVATMCR